MPFIKLEELGRKNTSEYFIRTELIQEVDIKRDNNGQIISLDVYLTDEEGTEFNFEDEEAAKAYAVLYPFLTAAAPNAGQ